VTQLQEATTVAVIGAGPAGLAMGACLRPAGLDFIILDKESAVGSSWRRHYARLHLHTVKRYSSLPFLPFPRNYPTYVPRKLMIEYLESYAEHFDLRPRFGQAVRSVRRDEGAWIVETADATLRAAFVVIASGYNAEPVVPSFAGMETFAGKVIHSADYLDAKPFATRSVLVIGMGNTGAEIALDLAEGGAKATISMRDGVHIVPRDLFGVPIQIVGMLATKLFPGGLNERVFPPILDFALGHPARYGIVRPVQGILQSAASGRIPVIDVGTMRKIAERAIRTGPGVAAITPDGAIFHDGSRGTFDAIILATGYRPNYQSFLGADAVTPSNGMDNKENSSIYAVGLRNSIAGLLREIGREATAVAADIRRRHHAR
jgi:cation diffusion facilitator CzcD-associated flavoprotein CzcO